MKTNLNTLLVNQFTRDARGIQRHGYEYQHNGAGSGECKNRKLGEL
ncbi:MAG: hypothetical protein GXP23_08310 [Gammaproteobacteria bacterium]|nr:hypothetical protein [Gammaproteobacteria bacterium]